MQKVFTSIQDKAQQQFRKKRNPNGIQTLSRSEQKRSAVGLSEKKKWLRWGSCQVQRAHSFAALEMQRGAESCPQISLSESLLHLREGRQTVTGLTCPWRSAGPWRAGRALRGEARQAWKTLIHLYQLKS